MATYAGVGGIRLIESVAIYDGVKVGVIVTIVGVDVGNCSVGITVGARYSGDDLFCVQEGMKSTIASPISSIEVRLCIMILPFRRILVYWAA